jgi:hypothetical protein
MPAPAKAPADKKNIPAVCSLGFNNAVADKEESPDQTLINCFFESVQQQPQQFSINNNADTVIIGAKGTEIYFPAGCFEYPGEHDVMLKKNISVELKECYNYSEMLAENLVTDNDDNLLKSAGMICINATSDGQKLELRKGYELPVSFNNKVDNNTFDLYYGDKNEKGELNWRLDPLACSASPVVMLTSSSAQNEETFFDRNYTFSKEDKMSLKNSSWKTSASFNEKGEVVGTEVSDYKDKARLSAVSRFHEVIQNYRHHVANSNFPSWEHQFSFTCISADSVEKLKEELAQESLESRLRLGRFINSKQTYYARATGWLNCDCINFLKPIAGSILFLIEKAHEIKVRNTETVNVVIGLENDGDNTDVKLVFAHDKSIVSGRVYGNVCIFEGVPKNKKFAVVATKCSEEGIFYTSKEGQSLDGKDIKINLAYTKYSTPEDVVAEYRKLDEQLE